MNYILGAILGYVIHDAVKPTIVGKTLDKIALPADLFVEPASESEEVQV